MPSLINRFSSDLRNISITTTRRALFLRIAAALLALITAIDVASTINQLHRRSDALGRTYPVVVARRDLPAGHKILRSDLGSMHLHSPPPNPEVRAHAIGERVDIPVLKGNVVTTRHLGTSNNLLPAGARGVRVVSNDARQLHARDVVDVFVTLDPERFSGGEPTREVISGATIIRIDRTSEGTSATLAVPLDLVPRLAFAVASGVITLASVPGISTR
ncbi:MAG: hypothetical protein JHC94_05135 [Acidimicrobiia bacterium]|nr:hypothetical protein [Acidimicrobiia bacterium]